MRLLVAWLLGLALGTVTGAAALYFNPFSRADAVAFSSDIATERLHYTTAGAGALAFTHGTSLDVEVHPASVPALFEAALAKTALGVLVVTDDAGTPLGLASRIIKLGTRTNPVTNGVVLAEDWLVTVPGSGTYHVESESNLWPFLRDTVVDVGLLARAWSGPREYRFTVGPSFTDTAIVVGVTGAYRDATGVAVDTLRLDGLSRLVQLREPIAGMLEIAFRPPETAAEVDTALSVAAQSP